MMGCLVKAEWSVTRSGETNHYEEIDCEQLQLVVDMLAKVISHCHVE